MSYNSLTYPDWLRGWREWARTRKRGKMAQFIIEKLEEGTQAKWLHIEQGVFELTEWHAIAKEWFGEKPRNSEEVDAPCMLRKGLPRAFPGLDEVKEKSKKEGTQYRSRVFKAPLVLINEVLLHVTNHHPGLGTYQDGGDHRQCTTTNYTGYPNNALDYNSTSTSTAIPFYGNSVTAPMGYTTSGVKIELPTAMTQQTSQNSNFSHIIGGNEDQFLPHNHGYRNPSEIDMLAQAIVENGMDRQGYYPTTSSTCNGLTYNTPPSSVSMLGVPQSPGTGFTTTDDVTVNLMGSPSGPIPPYGHSPGSSHSPRISPEPSISSYPPSVTEIHQHSVINGSEMSPPGISSPVIRTIEEHQEYTAPEIMEVKAMPNKSPLEGGGQMALVFYKQLPIGRKSVYFVSSSNPNYIIGQSAVDENLLTLSCPIPKYPIPEEVELRVYCEQQPIAATTFTFYQHMPPSDMILQILSSQLQSHFPGQSPMGGSGSSGSGGQNLGGVNYGGYIPNSMYQLLLGACRLGCEPLVHCLLCSPVMEQLTSEQMKEAHECAQSNGHTSLAEHLLELFVLHDMTVLIARNGENDKKHAPAYYDCLDGLDQGGDTAQARAETVLKQVLVAIKSNQLKEEEDNEVVKKEEEEVQETEDDVTTPIVEFVTLGDRNVDELTVQMEQTNISLKRRLSSSSRLKRQSNSISDDDENIPSDDKNLLTSSSSLHSRGSWSERDDIVPDLVSHRRKHAFTQQSDADSAIGLSFEEDTTSLIFSEVQRRKSSSVLPPGLVGQSHDTISIQLTPEAGMEVANSLEWEAAIVVTEDYPPSQDSKIFYKGDKIVQVGDRLIRNMTAQEFSEFFQTEAAAGTTLKIVPNMDKTPLESVNIPGYQKLRRTPSEQAIYDNIKSKINQLISMRPPNAEREVTIPKASSGFGIKMIGGKTVGVFISDIRIDVTQVSAGDQILEINGRSMRGLSLYDASQILRTMSGDLKLTVVENKAKFTHVREQVELDSLYLRSLVDHTPTSNREMTLKKGSLLRVVNTFVIAPNYWLAWSLDERTGVEPQLKRIPSPSYARKQFGCEAYERVERSDVVFRRPVCIVGPGSDNVADIISKEDGYRRCESVEEVLAVCAKGSYHAVLSTSDTKKIELLTALQCIVLQTPTESVSLLEQVKFTKMNIDSYLTGEKSFDLAQHAVHQVQQLQTLPIWRPMGVIY